MNFSEKNALVTGGARGIGLAVARILAKSGANVLLADCNAVGLETAKCELSAYGTKILTFGCDVSDENQVSGAAEFALSQFGKIDILVNNAGIYRDGVGLFENSTADTWKKKININILGTMLFTRALIGNMLDNGYGRIINLASVAGVYGIAAMTDYSMTKGAVIGFTKALAKEVTGRGVTVNAVSPGSIDDDPLCMTEHAFIGRAGSFEECANVICFLASDEASYVSGQNYIVDGCRKKM